MIESNLPFRPKLGFFGDPIPFFWQGEYHVFYVGSPLNDPVARRWLSTQGVGHNFWGHIASRDLLNWTEYPSALEPGKSGEPDSDACGTGSVIEKDGVFHIFYLGRAFTKENNRYETICHATSTDLITWKKDGPNPVLPPQEDIYETADWRDPFVFWNKDDSSYWMLITARVKTGPINRRGCIALAKSKNLSDWTVHPPFWHPELYITLECPDLFYWNKHWYLIYSEFTSTTVTRYCRGKNLAEQFKPTHLGRFDGTSFYAAKTIADEKRRFLLGWIHTREGNSDEGSYQWGGDLGIPRELIENSKKEIDVTCPEEFYVDAQKVEKLEWSTFPTTWTINKNKVTAERIDGYSFSLLKNKRKNYFLHGSIKFLSVGEAGFIVRTDDQLSDGYEVRISSINNSVSIAKIFGKPRQVITQNYLRNPISKSFDCKMFVRDTVIEVFINDQISLSCRIYNKDLTKSGIFVEYCGVIAKIISLEDLYD